MSKDNIKEIIIFPPETVIKKEIYNFLLLLFKNIFLKPKNEEKNKEIVEKLKKWIEAINKNPLQSKNQINLEYSINNFKNIIYFIKTQNRLLAGDILEGILILIFSYAFKTEKYNTFGEFIYKNDEGKYKLEDSTNFDLIKWFEKNVLLPKELNDLKYLLEKEEKKEKDIANDSPLYYCLLEIQKLKFININLKNLNTNFDKYIYRRNFLNQKIIDINFTKNFIQKNIIRHFFISVFIYYQNKYSPLMKYIKEETKEFKYPYEEEDESNNKVKKEVIEKKFLAGIPFEYDLSEAELDNRFANTVLSPSRIEPRISQIIMNQNKLEERGFFELAKVLIFNKYVKKCSFDNSFIKSFYLDYFNLGLGIYDNNSLEELNLSFNNINNESIEYLDKIIIHLKNLKTINLSSNDVLQKGVCSFLVMLKRLYRENKTKLENLVLNKCALDNSSIYELGELLKCKYCKLKRLYLNTNNIPANTNILKRLKKNKNLTEVYLNKNNFNGDNIDDIMRIISNTHIQTLYLFKNKIYSFNDILRIIYRTKIVKNEKEELDEYQKDKKCNLGHSSFLGNLDLSDNYCWTKNEQQLSLLKNIIKDTSLYSLDISHILAGQNPSKYLEATNQNNLDYRTKINGIKEDLEKEKEEYEENYEAKKDMEVDKEENEQNLEEYKQKILDIKEFKEFGQKVIELLEKKCDKDYYMDERGIYPLFLREKAKEIITTDIVKQEDKICEKIKDKLTIKKENEKEDEVDFEFYSILEKYLLYKMTLSRIDWKLKEIKDKNKSRKLIII